MRRNVLIFHSGALGDFILTWPLAMALGRLLPQSRIFYVTHGQKGKLAEKVLGIESTDVEAGWHHLFAEPAQAASPPAHAAPLTAVPAAPPSPAVPPALPAPAVRLLAGAQWVFTFGGTESSTWSANIARLAPEARVVGLAPAPPADFTGHLTDFLVEQLHPWPAWEHGVRQILRSIADRGIALRRPRGGEAPGNVTVIHPGSGSPQKCWPHESFLELARRLDAARKDGPRPRVILGEVELERWPAARIEAFAAVAEVRRPQTLLELLDACAGAARFIGNDSGPAHLAAIVGIPTLSLFGPTDPARWRPLGPSVRTLQRTPLDQLSVDEVEEESVKA